MIQQFHFWVYIRRNPNTNSQKYMDPYVHCSIIYNSQAMEATQGLIKRWTGKKVMEYYLVIKKNDVLLFATA